jgi:hypothetical protein
MSTQQSGNDFFAKYTGLMVSVWQDESVERELLANPTARAAASGLPVADGSVVVVDRTQPESLFTKEELLADWNGTPGRHILHIPASALIERNELDERELDAVAAGAANVTIVIVACIVAA